MSTDAAVVQALKQRDGGCRHKSCRKHISTPLYKEFKNLFH
jgi:hypothetical protein